MNNHYKIFLAFLFAGITMSAVLFLFLFEHQGKSAMTEVLPENTNSVPVVKQESPKYMHLAANFELALKKVSNVKLETSRIFGLVVQHHLVATPLINRNFSLTADYYADREMEIKQIVILSPNHFLVPGKIFTSDGDWQTKYGVVANDQVITEKLVNNNFAQINYTAMEKEHGVFDLLPFMKYYFPEAKVIPLVISESVSLAEAKKLAEFLNKNLDDESLVILSADFSHYLPERIADFHDQASIAGLANFDYGFTRQMDIDNPASLEVLFKYLENINARRFVLLDNLNSQDMMSNVPLQETTSYVSGYFTSGNKVAKEQVTLHNFGDMMLDRNVMTLSQKSNSYDYPFQKFDLFLKGADYKLANFEGPMTDFQSVSVSGNHFQFTFSPKFLPALKKRFQVFSLANNHTANFGSQGLDQTRSYLAKSGLGYFGDPSNDEEYLSKIIEKNGLKIALLGYHGLVQSDWQKIISEVNTQKKQTDFVIVYPHWGNEYKEFASATQQTQAHELIDAGADLIIGSHPHVIQPLEIYKEKVIFYSLGNFVFDQYFSEQVQTGLSVGLVINKDYNKVTASYYLLPYKISDASQVEVMTLKEQNNLLDKLSKNSTVTDKVKQMIKNGLISEIANKL